MGEFWTFSIGILCEGGELNKVLGYSVLGLGFRGLELSGFSQSFGWWV